MKHSVCSKICIPFETCEIPTEKENFFRECRIFPALYNRQNGGAGASTSVVLTNDAAKDEANVISPNLSRRRLHKSYGLYRYTHKHSSKVC